MALGSWLVSHSHRDRSSPIRRGAWIADQILCQPVEAPPAGLEIGELPPLEEGLSVRDMLEQHRSDPVCSGCHAYLDIVGMGFEVFDASGREREDAVDTLGELPTGQTFEGAAEFAAHIDQQAFVSCLYRKLFVYGVGRAPRPDEEPSLGRGLEPDATLADLVAHLVTRPQFNPTGEPRS